MVVVCLGSNVDQQLRRGKIGLHGRQSPARFFLFCYWLRLGFVFAVPVWGMLCEKVRLLAVFFGSCLLSFFTVHRSLRRLADHHPRCHRGSCLDQEPTELLSATRISTTSFM